MGKIERMFAAAQRGNLNCIMTYCYCEPALFFALDSCGCSLFSIACEEGHTNIVQWYLSRVEMMADLSIRAAKEGCDQCMGERGGEWSPSDCLPKAAVTLETNTRPIDDKHIHSLSFKRKRTEEREHLDLPRAHSSLAKCSAVPTSDGASSTTDLVHEHENAAGKWNKHHGYSERIHPSRSKKAYLGNLSTSRQCGIEEARWYGGLPRPTPATQHVRHPNPGASLFTDPRQLLYHPSCTGRDPLVAAAALGREDVVRVLLSYQTEDRGRQQRHTNPRSHTVVSARDKDTDSLEEDAEAKAPIHQQWSIQQAVSATIQEQHWSTLCLLLPHSPRLLHKLLSNEDYLLRHIQHSNTALSSSDVDRRMMTTVTRRITIKYHFGTWIGEQKHTARD